jgi:hypothetical protein
MKSMKLTWQKFRQLHEITSENNNQLQREERENVIKKIQHFFFAIFSSILK